jgi:hypothetical protein
MLLVPSRFDTGRDFGERLFDFPAGDRGRGVLQLGAL